MKFAGIWRDECFSSFDFMSDYDNCMALDDSVETANRQRVGLCASRGLLYAIAIVKALLMVAWMSREHLLREYDCQTADWLNSRTFDRLDTSPNSAEPIVLKRRNGGATVWFTDEDFTPRQPSIFPVNEGETVDANDRIARRRRSVDDAPSHSSEEILREDIPLRPGKRRRIVKIVRRPLTVERVSDDLDGSFRRHWREVSPKTTDISAGTSEDESRAGIDASGKLLRRVKIIKRRRKPKKIEENDTVAFVRPTSETVSSRQSDADWRRRSVQTDQSVDREEFSNERSAESDILSTTMQSPSLRHDVMTQKSPNIVSNIPHVPAANPSPLSQPLQSTNSGESKSSADKIASHFLAQFRVFKRDALCVARTLLDAWCGVQLAALLLFLIGVTGYRRAPAAVKYLLMPHLILDSLLLLTLFVFVLTTVVFGALLFTFVAEMTLGQLGIWLAFAGLLTSLLVVYGVAFTLTLRCSKTIIHHLRQPAVNRFEDGSATCGCLNCRGDPRSSYDGGDRFSQHQLLIGHPVNV